MSSKEDFNKIQEAFNEIYDAIQDEDIKEIRENLESIYKKAPDFARALISLPLLQPYRHLLPTRPKTAGISILGIDGKTPPSIASASTKLKIIIKGNCPHCNKHLEIDL